MNATLKKELQSELDVNKQLIAARLQQKQHGQELQSMREQQHLNEQQLNDLSALHKTKMDNYSQQIQQLQEIVSILEQQKEQLKKNLEQ